MDTNTDIMSAAAADQQGSASPASLDSVKALGAQLVQVELDLTAAEATVTRLKQLREEIRIRQLPAQMFELGIDSLGVGNRVLEREPLIQASLPKDPEPRAAAINWLVDHQHGGVIKREVVVALPKGDAATEHKVLAAIRAAAPGIEAAVGYDIHYQTYLALCKRLVKSGAVIPLKALGIFVGSIVRIQEN